MNAKYIQVERPGRNSGQMFQKGREESPVSISNTCVPQMSYRGKVLFNCEEEEGGGGGEEEEEEEEA